MKRKLVTALLITTMMFSMVACGNTKAENENSTPSQSTGQETQQTESQQAGGTQEAGTKYVFEAEYTVLEGLEGLGVSGSPTGIGLAKENSNTSNGFYVGELGEKSPITFVINSDTDATATLKAVFGSNTLGNCTWNSNSFNITVNGEAIDYPEFTTDNGTDINNQENFKKKNLGEIQLVAGENVIVFTAGDNTYRGNMPSAPSIDCLEITTDATLTMEEMESNIE